MSEGHELLKAIGNASGANRFIEASGKEAPRKQKVAHVVHGLLEMFCPVTGTIIREVIETEKTTAKGKKFTAIWGIPPLAASEFLMDVAILGATKDNSGLFFPILMLKNTVLNYLVGKAFKKTS